MHLRFFASQLRARDDFVGSSLLQEGCQFFFCPVEWGHLISPEHRVFISIRGMQQYVVSSGGVNGFLCRFSFFFFCIQCILCPMNYISELSHICIWALGSDLLSDCIMQGYFQRRLREASRRTKVLALHGLQANRVSLLRWSHNRAPTRCMTKDEHPLHNSCHN
uniref:Uncharacterized protein n=1 Tax=Eutreptiella gymnastica TaxID=73025 RepID=A0A7S4LD85_9EUGL